MSGYKRATVTISEEEYRRLHQADMKRRLKEPAKGKGRKKNLEPSADLTNAFRQMENRQQQLEETLRELGDDFDQAHSAVIQDVVRQNALQYEQMLALLQETASEAHESIASVSERLGEQMQQEREQYHRSLQSLVQRLDTQATREQTRAKAARHWLRQAAALADLIQEQFDHERFLPGKLSRVRASLDLAQDNLAQGFSESSLQTSQQAFLELSDLHLELEQRLMVWQTEYRKAYGALDDFVRELEWNATLNAFGLDGEELPEQVDIAYWSNGIYTQLVEKSRQLLAILSQEQHHITTEELTRTYTQLLPGIREKFETIVYEARLNALSSQLRMNIAERALQALEVHGFTLNEAGYLDQDMRGSFTAQLANADGSRVTIQVLPSDKTTEELTNDLVVITEHPYLKTEHEARLQWEELARSLNQFDLQVSRPRVSDAVPATAHSEDITTDKQPDRLKRPHHVQ